MQKILGVILAGGLGTRMGNIDKCLIIHHQNSILEHIVNLAKPQVDALILNANGDLRRFEPSTLPIVPDVIADYGGPIIGVISAMTWADENSPEHLWIASFASDTPYFPTDLISKLHNYAQQNSLNAVYAKTATNHHYPFALWSTSLLPTLRELYMSGERRLHQFLIHANAGALEFPQDPLWFFNVNTIPDLKALEQLASK